MASTRPFVSALRPSMRASVVPYDVRNMTMPMLVVIVIVLAFALVAVLVHQ